MTTPSAVEAPAHIPLVASCGSVASLADTAHCDASPRRLPVSVKFDAPMAELGELRAECIARGQSKEFMRETLEVRCRRLFPRDLIVAQVPTKKGGLRVVGVLRRSLRWCKVESRCIVYVDYLYVMRSHRGQGIGRKLLESAMLYGRKPKPVGLMVAGSEANVCAVALYESVGFGWTDRSCTEMLAPEAAVARLATMRTSPTDATPKSETTSILEEQAVEAEIAQLSLTHAPNPPPAGSDAHASAHTSA